jgi:hypothetical protein
MCHVLIIEDEFCSRWTWRSARGAWSEDVRNCPHRGGSNCSGQAPKADFITSDVVLLEGSGPQAIQAILQEIGPVPVVLSRERPRHVSPAPRQGGC